MTDTTFEKVIFEGHKFFWRQRIDLDISIVHHADREYVEIIPYDRNNMCEFPRIYLSWNLLRQAIQPQYDTKLAEIKIAMKPDNPQVIETLVKELMGQYVLDHLLLASDGPKRLTLNPLSSKIISLFISLFIFKHSGCHRCQSPPDNCGAPLPTKIPTSIHQSEQSRRSSFCLDSVSTNPEEDFDDRTSPQNDILGL
jgi:hypothetical protein